MKTEVLYTNLTHTGKVEITVNCHDEMEYLISIENRKWLYPKIENMLFISEHLIRADPSIVHQLNKVLNKAVDDISILIKISMEKGIKR